MSQVTELFTELADHLNTHNYDGALQTCSKILKINPEDGEILTTKLACLIHLNKFEEALEEISQNKKHEKSFLFQKAYCYYRLHKTKEALEVLNKAGPDADDKFKELKAQVYYRNEEFEKCGAIYESLIAAEDDGYNSERQVNLCAAYASSKQSQKIEEAESKLKGSSYELLYNLGCLAIESKQYKKALSFLFKSKIACKSSLEEDDYTELEIEEEMTIIDLQIAVVNQLMNNGDSGKVFQKILDSDCSDISLLGIAEANLMILDDDVAGSFNLSEEQLKKMNKHQTSIINANVATYLYKKEKYSECQEKCVSLTQQDPEWDVPILLQAAVFLKLDDSKSAISLLKAHKSIPSCIFALAQILVQQNHYDEALNVLQENKDILYLPAVVSAVISLYKHLNVKDAKAYQLLTDAKNHLEGSDSLQELLSACGHAAMSEGKYEEAAKNYEEALKIDNSKPELLAALILAYAEFDHEKAEMFAEQLPERTINVDSIEGLLENNHVYKEKVKTSRDGKRRKRKGKLPKDLNKPLDEERWMPLWQRSTNKRKKRNVAVRGPQGVAASTSEAAVTGSSQGVKGKR